MAGRLTVLLALVALALGAAGCGTAEPVAEVGGLRPSTFEAWAARNGTGGFFGAVGPAGGSGVRSAWPE